MHKHLRQDLETWTVPSGRYVDGCTVIFIKNVHGWRRYYTHKHTDMDTDTHTHTHTHTHTLVIWSKWIQTNNPKSVIYRLASWPCSFLTLFKDIYFDITHKYNTKWFIRWHSSSWNHIDLIELTRWRQVLSILRQGSIGNVCYSKFISSTG